MTELRKINYIAEAGQTMRGDVGLAVEMVHAFAEAGATHFKVQMLNPDTIATDDAPSYWSTGPSVQQRKSFTDNGLIPYDGWERVRRACDDARIGFVATPFDLEAVAALRDLDPALIKVASGDITYTPLLNAVAELDKDVLLSTGAATSTEVVEARVRLMSARGSKLYVIPMACTLAYPTHMNDAQLWRINALDKMGLANPCGVGYSDHTTALATSGPAVLAGSTWLEKHVSPFADTAGDPRGVPDDKMALNVFRFKKYVTIGNDAALLLGKRDDQQFGPIESEQPARHGARRAARYAYDYDWIGGSMGAGCFTFLRPDPDGDGSSIDNAMRVVQQGSPLTRAVKAGDIVRMEDFA